jgi:endonuclease YncB( thermonuclease family)
VAGLVLHAAKGIINAINAIKGLNKDRKLIKPLFVMAKIVVLFSLLASLFLPLSAIAADDNPYAELAPPEQIQVVRVIDPLRLQLANGKIIQLSGVEIPDLDPHEPGERAAAALAAMKPLLENKNARLYRTRDPKRGRVNRMGHELGHVETAYEEPIWIQGWLISEGYARARPDAANPEMAAAMQSLEDTARTDKKGLWADPVYAVRTPETAGELTGRYGMVEGTIYATAMNNNNIFLNFGPDWRNDFTIGLDSPIRRAFTKANLDPLQFTRRKIRVRGWVENYNGPFIRLTDISQLQFINEPEQTEESEQTKETP